MAFSREIKNRMVKEVDKLRSEFQPGTLGHAKVLVDAQVYIRVARASDGTDATVAVRAGNGLAECACAKPLNVA